jgi:hypothetical protein
MAAQRTANIPASLHSLSSLIALPLVSPPVPARNKIETAIHKSDFSLPLA